MCPWGACPQHDSEIRAWAAEGLSLSEIARRIGTKNQCVRAHMTRNNIQYLYRHSVGRNNSAWKGGRIADKSGYVLVHCPDHPHANRNGYIREHRLVMEKNLGRHLLPDEVVHHKDENKQNNHPDNLELYTTNAEHLAETLRGQVPNWTEEGKARIREQNRQGVKDWWAATLPTRKRRPNGTWQKTGDSPSPEPTGQTAA